MLLKVWPIALLHGLRFEGRPSRRKDPRHATYSIEPFLPNLIFLKTEHF